MTEDREICQCCKDRRANDHLKPSLKFVVGKTPKRGIPVEMCQFCDFGSAVEGAKRAKL